MYVNKQFKDVLLVMFKGYLYIFQNQNNIYNMIVKPISLLDDVNRIIYSEHKEQYLALKIRDMKKQDNKFDHLILMVKNRELFADFVILYADQEDDEIIFENNEEFSIIINSTP